MSGRDFRLPDGHSGDVATDAQAENQSCNDELRKVKRCGHQDGADDGDKVGPEDDLFAAEKVTQIDA